MPFCFVFVLSTDTVLKIYFFGRGSVLTNRSRSLFGFLLDKENSSPIIGEP